MSFTSAGGSLLAGDTPDPFDSFVANTANHVAVESDSPLVIDGLVTTNVFYNDAVDSRDIQFSYETRRSDEIDAYPGDFDEPDVSTNGVLATHLDENGRIVVTNLSDVNPVKMFGAEFRSEAGLLQFHNEEPFKVAFGPSSTYVPIADPEGEAEIDGSLTFDISYLGDINDLLNGDLTVTISPVAGQGLGSQVSAPLFAFENDSSDTVLPEPSGQLLCLFAVVGSLTFRRRR